ncbi:unnamed protein product [marine sediment metagenome]|uniref:Uncharacterized protein n=1 Tax=marine sediment metagenome TaxID=412755 RepID=X0TNW6_9ZZZZ
MTRNKCTGIAVGITLGITIPGLVIGVALGSWQILVGTCMVLATVTIFCALQFAG